MLISLDQMKRSKITALLLSFGGLLFLSLLLYVQVFQYDWTYDDFMVIVNNPDVRSFSAFLQDNYPGRPLRELTFLLDYHVFGMTPAGWHLQNLLWHGTAAFLMLCLVRSLGASRVVAWGAALLFLCHPIQVEAVASISHRKESLVLVFSLCALLAYMAAPRRTLPWLWYLFAFFLYLVAFQAKQIAIVLPVLALIYEACYVPPEQRLLFRHRWLWIVSSIIAGLAWLFWLVESGGIEHYQQWSENLLIKMEYYGPPTIATYVQMVSKAWAFMALRVIYPVDLAVEYLYPLPLGWLDPWVITGLLLFAAGLVGLYLLRKQPMVLFALSWAGLFWLPTSNLWPLAYPAADRYLYASMLGLTVLAAVVLAGDHRYQRFGRVALICVIVSCAAITWQQVQYWKSDETVHQQALRVSPNSSFLHNELGKIYEKAGQSGRSLEYYRSAVRINPKNAAAHYNLGKLLEQAGLVPQALEHYAQFLLLDNPAYRDAEQKLRTRLKAQYGLKLNETE